MANIELVIKIPEELYEAYKGRPPMLGDAGMDMIARAIANGIPYDERPQGEWTNGESKCPCCGEDKFKDLDADIWADWQPNFCPNCGADMRPKGEWDIYGGIL